MEIKFEMDQESLAMINNYNNNMKKYDVLEIRNVIRDQAKKFADDYYQEMNKKYVFDLTEIIAIKIYKECKNLKIKYVDEYMHLTIRTINDLNPDTDSEKLVWANIIIHSIDQNHNSILPVIKYLASR